MKYTIHLPTEQYGFVEAEFDGELEAVEPFYRELADQFKPKPTNSLPTKEFNGFLDRQLLGEGNHIDEYEKMSPQQKQVVQEVKKALARIKSKLDK